MTTVFVIWDRNNKQLVGGANPQVFMTSALATTASNRTLKYTPNGPKGSTAPVYDVVAVTA